MSGDTTLDEPEPVPGFSTKIDTGVIDQRLPEGEVLVEVWADGQVHLAFREQPHDGWPKGAWTVLPGSFQ
jgi:hypothetical protein